MKCAVIDIGSNSMRLSVYETEKTRFETLFKEKIMAGLGGYVTGGALSKEGIDCACDGLLQFQKILNILTIDSLSVFATASLRNIVNTDEAVRKIKTATGFDVEVLSGKQEAAYGYNGAMYELDLADGLFVDIGGASTEIVPFRDKKIVSADSVPVGSLKLYTDCVKKILPGKSSKKKIEEQIDRVFREENLPPVPPTKTLACVGGSARAAFKLARSFFGLDAGCNKISVKQAAELFAFLSEGGKEAVRLILKTEPERIHTILPGSMILQKIITLSGAEEIQVSQYGVREGYLCQRIQTNL